MLNASDEICIYDVLQPNKRSGFSYRTDNLGALVDIWTQISTCYHNVLLIKEQLGKLSIMSLFLRFHEAPIKMLDMIFCGFQFK